MKSQEDKDFINAAGAIYAWMCAADGVVTVDESEGFADYINNSPYVNTVTKEEFIEAYSEIAYAFEVDFEDGYNRALTRIEPFKSDKKIAFNLIKVARDALVADEKLEEVEENIIRELCLMFEIDESEVS